MPDIRQLPPPEIFLAKRLRFDVDNDAIDQLVASGIVPETSKVFTCPYCLKSFPHWNEAIYCRNTCFSAYVVKYIPIVYIPQIKAVWQGEKVIRWEMNGKSFTDHFDAWCYRELRIISKFMSDGIKKAGNSSKAFMDKNIVAVKPFLETNHLEIIREYLKGQKNKTFLEFVNKLLEK